MDPPTNTAVPLDPPLRPRIHADPRPARVRGGLAPAAARKHRRARPRTIPARHALERLEPRQSVAGALGPPARDVGALRGDARQQGRLDGPAVLRALPDARGRPLGPDGEPAWCCSTGPARSSRLRSPGGSPTASGRSASCGARCSCRASCMLAFPVRAEPARDRRDDPRAVGHLGVLPPGEPDDHGRPRLARAAQDRVRAEPPRDQPRHERRARRSAASSRRSPFAGSSSSTA